MKTEKLPLEGLFLIQPDVFEDNRGYFFESFNKKKFMENTGLDIEFVQDNQSLSSFGVLRGLHFQKAPFEQSKLVRVLSGEVLDVVVDIRKDSETFGQYFSIILDDKKQQQLFVPKGFAHAFLTLSDHAIFHYKVDQYYKKEADAGINYKDEDLNIDWRIEHSNLILSEKDQKLPFMSDL
jgi:dTDP-4-dehydrorhamnose 3,5-epimerase